MWRRHSSRVIALIALIAVLPGLGCQGAEPARAPSRGVAAGSAAAPASPAWYRSARTLDVTGDGRADSVRLDAVGARPDSLQVTLSILVDGEERFREAWGSSYELALVDSAARARSGVETILRARLDSVLASVVVRPLAAPGVRLMAEDSTLLAGLQPRPTQLLSFSYGYETTVRLVWDAPRERFVRLWSCC
jgi:hypothetical protein